MRLIIFADLSGTITTMIVLTPILFVSWLSTDNFWSSDCYASFSIGRFVLYLDYDCSVIVALLLKVKKGFNYIISRINDAIQAFFSSIVRGTIAFKSVAFALLVVLIALFVISVKLVIPTVGQELIPPSNRHQNNHPLPTQQPKKNLYT